MNSRCFCWFPAVILVHQNATPIRRLHTKFYKGAWNVSANNSEAAGHKDLRLGKIVYKLVFYNISFSCLLQLDGFQFMFCCVTVKTTSIGFWSKSRGLFASGPVFGCYSWPWVFSFIGVPFFLFFSFNLVRFVIGLFSAISLGKEVHSVKVPTKCTFEEKRWGSWKINIGRMDKFWLVFLEMNSKSTFYTSRG